MPDVAKQLLAILNSLDESSEFCTSGTLDPVLPGLQVTGAGDIGLSSVCPANTKAARLRFRAGKDRRRHLHQQIDSHRCDLSHVTDRRGSPQTLVCTKNRNSYKRKKKQFETDTKLLTELRPLVENKRKKKLLAIATN